MVFIMSQDIRISLKDIYRILERQEKTRLTINGRKYIIKTDATKNCDDAMYMFLFDETSEDKVAYITSGYCYDGNPLTEQLNNHLYSFVFGHRTYEPYRNKGIMTRFIQQVTSVILSEYDSVVLIIMASNKRSEKVAIKNGYNHIRDYIVEDLYDVKITYPVYIKTKETNNEKL